MTLQLEGYQVVLLGCGQMGSALISGAVASGRVEPTKLTCVDLIPERADALAESLGAWSLSELPDPQRGPRLVVVAVKPQDVESVLTSYDLGPEDVVVSVAAGVSMAKLEAWSGQADVVRAMPNTPSLVGKGVTGVYSRTTCPAALALFESVGMVVPLAKESLFDALTGVSGSGPAYVFVILEALADGGVKMGLDRETARRIAAATVEGAAALAGASDVHTAELKDRVASPGGTTIAALAHLEEKQVRAALIGAVEVAARRSAEMSEKLS